MHLGRFDADDAPVGEAVRISGAERAGAEAVVVSNGEGLALAWTEEEQGFGAGKQVAFTQGAFDCP